MAKDKQKLPTISAEPEGKGAAQAAEKEKKRVYKKKKVRKHVATGIVHVQSTFNNTMITFTDATGNTLSWSSAGARGCRAVGGG